MQATKRVSKSPLGNKERKGLRMQEKKGSMDARECRKQGEQPEEKVQMDRGLPEGRKFGRMEGMEDDKKENWKMEG